MSGRACVSQRWLGIALHSEVAEAAISEVNTESLVPVLLGVMPILELEPLLGREAFAQ